MKRFAPVNCIICSKPFTPTGTLQKCHPGVCQKQRKHFTQKSWLAKQRVRPWYFNRDLPAKYMSTVDFKRTSVMDIPCSWMPGGYIRIGGKEI